jgi:hypothetical protein
MEKWLAEMKLRARRKIGEISKGLDKGKPGVKSELSRTTATQSKRDSLKEAGISKDVANRCEHIADIPEEEFETVY